MLTTIHVLPHEYGLWKIRFEGEDKDHSVYGNRFAAIETAGGIARNHRPAKLVVHKEDGNVEFEVAHLGDANSESTRAPQR